MTKATELLKKIEREIAKYEKVQDMINTTEDEEMLDILYFKKDDCIANLQMYKSQLNTYIDFMC